MQTQVKEQEYTTYSQPAVETPNSAPIIQAKQTAVEVNKQIQTINQQISHFFTEIPNNVSRFYQEYPLLIIGFALLVVTVIALRIGLAVVGAVNSIPLVKPFLELIGMGYTFWFASRYLIQNLARKELN